MIKTKLVIILGILYISMALLIFLGVPKESLDIFKEITKDYTIGFLGWLTSESLPDIK